MSDDCSHRTIKFFAASKWQLALITINATSMGLLALLVASLVQDAIQGPAANYESVVTLTPEVPPGGSFEARVVYKKNRDCAGTLFVNLVDETTGEAHVVSTMPLGDRPPGTFTVMRRYQVPISAPLGPAHFYETLNYQCNSGNSIVRSPPMRFHVKR